ncbi:MAG: gliding motility protein [Cyclobacteriaceae bacterium]|nr:MAG: gliding motility protein [Cyclobacteriaceae bacterium]
MNTKRYLYNVGFWFVIWLAISCSAEKDTLVSKTYHNVTAHYNAYFYANQHLQEVKAAIETGFQPNYNRILEVFTPVDTTIVASNQDKLEDAIKKAALAIQFHKNSDWVDDSYVLIGKVKFLQGKYEEAIQTFKYVKSISEDDNTVHDGLITLMRTYIDYGEMNNAIAVSDFLKKEELSKSNQKNLYLVRAYMYQKREDLDNMVQNLVEAVQLMSLNEGSAKIYFIIGQVYQTLGFDAEAYHNYLECVKSNPPYELSFYASLNMAQVFELARSNDLKKVRKYYQKILRDRKNKEFRDKIYYEMAGFEMNQGDLNLAIEFYESSIAASVGNQRQKAYSYLQLGLINYDTLKDFSRAKAYYDSTMMVLPADEPEYENINERQQILEVFVTQLNTIQLQDSLLTLSFMDSTELSVLLDSVIIKEEQRALEEEEKRQQQEAQFSGRNIFNEDNTASVQSGATWYFYNTSAISTGQSEFIRRWGNRPLEDHWRRSNKDAQVAVVDSEEVSEDTSTPEDAEEESIEDIRAARKEALYNTIPFTDEERQTADSLIEISYYNLGNIYDFQLEEKVNAYQTFETMIERYPDTEYKPELLYQLYLIYTDLEHPRAQVCKDLLLNDFPNSSYAKTLLNPQYKLEYDALAESMKEEYKKAYELYRGRHYDSALQITVQALTDTPENSFTDNLKLLEIMIIGQTGNLYNYRFELEKFIKEFPDSELNEYAQKLLRIAHELPLQLAKLGGATFKQNLNRDHLFVIVYPTKRFEDGNLAREFDQFNKEHFNEGLLSASSLILEKDQAMVLVQDFGDKVSALSYFDTLKEQGFLDDYSSEEFSTFVITKENFEIFYRTKDLKGYLSFFNNFYME